jgi:hypothetical protein
MSERMNWDHHADHDLLTAMMQELQPSQEQLRGVMARMHGFGYTCTVKAITYIPYLLTHPSINQSITSSSFFFFLNPN